MKIHLPGLRMYALWVVNLNLASESPGPRFKLDLE